MIEIPRRRFRSRKGSMIVARSDASTIETGSSAMIRRGLTISSRATITRRRWPPLGRGGERPSVPCGRGSAEDPRWPATDRRAPLGHCLDGIAPLQILSSGAGLQAEQSQRLPGGDRFTQVKMARHLALRAGLPQERLLDLAALKRDRAAWL